MLRDAGPALTNVVFVFPFFYIISYGILRSMSKLLQQAIEKVRELPEEEQDMAAAELIGYLSDFPTSEERSAITEGRRAYERREFISLDQWRHDMGLDTH
jgi:hypothetical protein